MDESKENLKALEEEMSALSQTKEALESKVADLREELNQVRTEDVTVCVGYRATLVHMHPLTRCVSEAPTDRAGRDRECCH